MEFNRDLNLPSYSSLLAAFGGAVESSSYELHVAKVVLSSNPVLHPDDFEVLLIYKRGRRLGVYKSADKAWTTSRSVKEAKFDDLIYHKDKIHLVDHGRVDYKSGIAKLWVASEHLPRLISTQHPVITVQTRRCTLRPPHLYFGGEWRWRFDVD
ncbi:F-box protein SKIP23 [Corchorus olitorius]|uniref:F-box protein SKIP23 n=1 Tax=Corchorus olitorius TaxID=93759 RepID=A0A1R3KP54_9ROSI|nr:F-box protein SKIP23 [Corchorus olitorius]